MTFAREIMATKSVIMGRLYQDVTVERRDLICKITIGSNNVHPRNDMLETIRGAFFYHIQSS